MAVALDLMTAFPCVVRAECVCVCACECVHVCVVCI